MTRNSALYKPTGATPPIIGLREIHKANTIFLRREKIIWRSQLFGHRVCAAFKAVKEFIAEGSGENFQGRLDIYGTLLFAEMTLYESAPPLKSLDTPSAYRTMREVLTPILSRRDDDGKDLVTAFDELPDELVVEEPRWLDTMPLGEVQWWSLTYTDSNLPVTIPSIEIFAERCEELGDVNAPSPILPPESRELTSESQNASSKASCASSGFEEQDTVDEHRRPDAGRSSSDKPDRFIEGTSAWSAHVKEQEEYLTSVFERTHEALIAEAVNSAEQRQSLLLHSRFRRRSLTTPMDSVPEHQTPSENRDAPVDSESKLGDGYDREFATASASLPRTTIATPSEENAALPPSGARRFPPSTTFAVHSPPPTLRLAPLATISTPREQTTVTTPFCAAQVAPETASIGETMSLQRSNTPNGSEFSLQTPNSDPIFNSSLAASIIGVPSQGAIPNPVALGFNSTLSTDATEAPGAGGLLSASIVSSMITEEVLAPPHENLAGESLNDLLISDSELSRPERISHPSPDSPTGPLLLRANDTVDPHDLTTPRSSSRPSAESELLPFPRRHSNSVGLTEDVTARHVGVHDGSNSPTALDMTSTRRTADVAYSPPSADWQSRSSSIPRPPNDVASSPADLSVIYIPRDIIGERLSPVSLASDMAAIESDSDEPVKLSPSKRLRSGSFLDAATTPEVPSSVQLERPVKRTNTLLGNASDKSIVGDARRAPMSPGNAQEYQEPQEAAFVALDECKGRSVSDSDVVHNTPRNSRKTAGRRKLKAKKPASAFQQAAESVGTSIGANDAGPSAVSQAAEDVGEGVCANTAPARSKRQPGVLQPDKVPDDHFTRFTRKRPDPKGPV
ncbi:hypothetical protein PENSPDRAFT_682118 [Peniophora sp. CONT]|nr:hypothetical protein PENSPDRAFT_682118 [Peniophora sp. CONT]